MAELIGRLGYACLNTVLRSTKPDSIFCSRTCRIASIKEEGLELPKALAIQNCKDLVKMIEVSYFDPLPAGIRVNLSCSVERSQQNPLYATVV